MNYHLKIALAYVFAGFFAGTAFAGDAMGIASKYEITMLKIELCTDAPLTTEEDVTCTGAVVVGTGNKVFDIAAVNVGATIGTFVSSTGLPIGVTYKYAKPTFSKKMTIRGAVALSAPSCNCRTDTNSVFHAGVGKYKSLLGGVCDAGNFAAATAAATDQVFHMNDLEASNGNKRCESADCTSNSATNYVRSPISGLNSLLGGGANNYLFGAAMENTPVGQTFMSAIYLLESPYTVTAVAPKIEIAFGTQTGLFASSFAGPKCYVDIFYPKVNIKVTN